MVSTLIIGLRCKSSGFYNSNIWCSVLEIYIKKVLSSVVVNTQKKKFGGMFFVVVKSGLLAMIVETSQG